MDSSKQGKLIGGLVALILGLIGIVYSIITMTSNDYVKWFGFDALGEWVETPEGITTIVILIVSIIGFITGGVLLLSLKSPPAHSNQRSARKETRKRILVGFIAGFIALVMLSGTIAMFTAGR